MRTPAKLQSLGVGTQDLEGRRLPKMPPFVPPQLCKALSRPPQGDDWVHEIKFDGYRMQLRVEDGDGDHAHAQRSRLDRQVHGDRKRCGRIARCASSMARWSPLTSSGAPDFAALQAALSEGRSQDLVYFVFDLLFDRRRGSARPSALRAQGPLEASAGQEQDLRKQACSLRRPSFRRRRCRVCSRPAACISKASSPSS